MAQPYALTRKTPLSNLSNPTTRSQLISASRTLFGRLGYEGTSVRAITAAAHANLGAVTYHFGSKEALYLEVLRTALAPLVEAVRVAVESAGSPLDRCEAVTRRIAAQLVETPDVPHLLMQEMARGRPPPEPVIEALQANSKRLTGVIRAGQAEGMIREGDPMLFALSLLSQPIYVALVRIPLQAVIGIDLSDAKAHARVTDHIAAFALAGLREDKEGS